MKLLPAEFQGLSKMEGIEDLRENSPQKIVFNFLNTCRCCNKTVLVRNHPVDIFGERSGREPEVLKVLAFLTGKEIKFGDGLPMKLCQPCYRKVKNIIEFRSLSHASLSSQELSIGGSRVKRVRGSQQVGNSPSSSQQAKKNRESAESVRMCLFAEDQHHPQFRPIAPRPPKNNSSAPRRLPQFLQVDKDATKEKEEQVSESPAVLSVPADIMRQSGLRKYEVYTLIIELLLFFLLSNLRR